LFATNDGRRNPIGDELIFFAGPETSERKNRFADAGFADLLAFGGAGYAEPVGAGFFKNFGDLRAAMAVAIALNDAQDFARRGAFFGFGIYEIADGMKVVAEGGERYISPDRTAVGVLNCLASEHASSFAFSRNTILRHWQRYVRIEETLQRE
jgi:hypothetical protein